MRGDLCEKISSLYAHALVTLFFLYLPLGGYARMMEDAKSKLSKKVYPEFEKNLRAASSYGDERTNDICEKCGRKMVVKSSRFGKFLACPGYPECKYTKSIVHDTGVPCPKCGGKIIKKK